MLLKYLPMEETSYALLIVSAPAATAAVSKKPCGAKASLSSLKIVTKLTLNDKKQIISKLIISLGFYH